MPELSLFRTEQLYPAHLNIAQSYRSCCSAFDAKPCAVFECAITHRPRIRLTIRQRMRVLDE
jgi:hypothetical protein